MTTRHNGNEGKCGVNRIRYIERSGGLIAAPGDSIRTAAENYCRECHGGRDRGMVPIERMGGRLGYWRNGELHIVGKTAHLISG